MQVVVVVRRTVTCLLSSPPLLLPLPASLLLVRSPLKQGGLHCQTYALEVRQAAPRRGGADRPPVTVAHAAVTVTECEVSNQATNT
jgi:hypothetical protein